MNEPMIWDRNKYGRVIAELCPIRWVKEDDGGYRYELSHGPDGWSLTEGFFPVEAPDDTERLVSDFEAGCILAEFAAAWLWKRHLACLVPALSRDGFVWRICRRVTNGWETEKDREFTHRHEALAEAILAILGEREE